MTRVAHFFRLGLTSILRTCTAALGVVALMTFLPGIGGAQEVPGRISYDGQLTDENGQLITNGAVTMKFALYDASSGGTKKWPSGASEDHVVSVQSGLFSVVLGSKEAMSTAIFADSLFLDIQVNDGSGLESLAPRQPFLSAPYALRAATADGIAAIDNLAAADLDLKRNSVTIATLISSGFKVNGVLLVDGNTGSTPVSGAGTRLMWVPAKAAFRAGKVSGTEWDDGNIGIASTVAGGDENVASGQNAAVGGGAVNGSSGFASVISGGHSNSASGNTSSVSGGFNNIASGLLSIISGGSSNTATSDHGTIGGGEGNTASGNWSTVAGGTGHKAGGTYAFVGGGQSNLAGTGGGINATVAGGNNNNANAGGATIAGGSSNTISAAYGSVGGGQTNTASGSHSRVGGGFTNTASGLYSIVSGGREPHRNWSTRRREWRPQQRRHGQLICHRWR